MPWPRKQRALILGEEPLAAHCAAALRRRGHEVVAVVTTSQVMRQWADEHAVPVVGRAEYAGVLLRGDIDVLWSITHPAIIPHELLALPRLDAINYHDGPLPRYAGINGSAWALHRGEPKHAIVWHRLAGGLDTGDILERRDVCLDARETSVSLNMRNAALALESFEALLTRLEAGPVTGSPQASDVARLEFSRHDRPAAAATIDWTADADDVDRLVRACDFGPYANRFGVAKLVHRGRAAIVRETSLIDLSAVPGWEAVGSANAIPPDNRPGFAGAGIPGAILDATAGGFIVACGRGAVAVERCSTLTGAELAPHEALRLLGLTPGMVIEDSARAGRLAVSRAVAEAEPLLLKRLLACEPMSIPTAPLPTGGAPLVVERVLDVPLELSDAAGGSATAAASLLAFVTATVCDQDVVTLALIDEPARRALGIQADELFAPAVPLTIAVDVHEPFVLLARHVRAQLDLLATRPAYLVDLITRTPALAHQTSAQEALARVAVILAAPCTADESQPISLPPGCAVAVHIDGQRVRLLLDENLLGARWTAAWGEWMQAAAGNLARGVTPTKRPLASIEVLDEASRARIVGEWNDTQRPFSDSLRIHELFERQADQRPNAIALVHAERSLTFAQLETRANRIAHALVRRGARPGAFVAFRVERGFDLVATMLGVCKAGAAYLPIDVLYPLERAAFMMADAHAEVLVTEHGRELPPGTDAARVLYVDDPEVDDAPATRLPCPSTASDVCYAIFTSGSTGTPKGVVLTHRAVMNTLEWVNRTFHVGPTDRLLFVTSPSFDLSVYDVFGALGAGASLEIAPTQLLGDPRALARKLVDPGITIWNSAPPALARLLPFLPPACGAPHSTLRLVMMSGDWIPVGLPDALRAVFPKVAPVSLGGATEAAIWSNFHEIGVVDPAWRSIPYGRPIQNARYYVLDKHLRPRPPGLPGDLYIGGACLAQEYLNRPQLTAARFVADPFVKNALMYQTGDLGRFDDDGVMELLGRADFQVKVRGFRVELGEIEAALRSRPGVRDCVCVTREDASGTKQIIAYVVPALGENTRLLDVGSLRSALANELPDFMVPSAILRIERLPTTSNGKLDRSALPAPATNEAPSEQVAPRTETERRLTGLWEALLQTGPVGVTDNFFDRGGHSLLATVLVTRLRNELGVDVPLSRILAGPTVAALAEAVDAAASTPPRASLGSRRSSDLVIALNEEGTKPPLFLVPGVGGQGFVFRQLAHELNARTPDQPTFTFRALGTDGDEEPADSIEMIAASYDRALRERRISGPVVLGGFSLGALVAFELARILRARGVPVLALIAFDAFAPGHPQKLPAWQRARIHAEALWSADHRARAAYLSARFQSLRRRLMFTFGSGARLAPVIDGVDAAQQARMSRIWALLMTAQRNYHPRFCEPGPMLLFRAAERFRWAGTLDHPMNGWSDFVRGPLEVIPVSGGHLDVFRRENIATMAEALTTFLARCTDGAPAPIASAKTSAPSSPVVARARRTKRTKRTEPSDLLG